MDVNETENIYLDPEVSLAAPDTASVIWAILCVIPNLLLIYIFVKHQLYRSNFYFIVGHWSLANILQMADTIYLGTVAQLYPSYQVPRTLEVVHWIISTAPVTFALLLIFDLFINSERASRYTVYNIWVSLFINTGVTIICIVFGFFHEAITVIGIVLILALLKLILLIRMAVFCIRSSNESRYPLRLTMSSLCIFTNFSLAVYLIIKNYNPKFAVEFLYSIVRYLTHTNGLVNLLLLINFDPTIKLNFYKVFGCKRNQSNVHFSVRKSIDPEEDNGNLAYEGGKVKI